MFRKYWITGATGFLGRAVIEALRETRRDPKTEIRALVLQDDPLARDLPLDVQVVFGDVCDEDSLHSFFDAADAQTCVIHCAGLISVASRPSDKIYMVNVGGTHKILRHCERCQVGKLIYISSVHAIPEKPKGTEITEDAVFSPELVRGDYAKSKAVATALVFEAARCGLNANVVFPSGIIGPDDRGKGSITHMLSSFLNGKLPLAVKGGYDFVDVRDVASGIIACADHGQPGRGYILSGQYASIRDILNVAKKTLHLRRTVLFLPIRLAKLVAPLHEKWSVRNNRPLYFTPYAVEILDSNGRFSRKAAEFALGYTPRSLESSIRDMVLWLKKSLKQP